MYINVIFQAIIWHNVFIFISILLEVRKRYLLSEKITIALQILDKENDDSLKIVPTILVKLSSKKTLNNILEIEEDKVGNFHSRCNSKCTK